MRFTPLPLAGAFSIAADPHADERGTFARIWDSAEFAQRGLSGALAQVNLSHNPRSGTLRGLHYQVAPHEEAKLVSCLRGQIWDVIVDLRGASPTYCQWHAEKLEGSGLTALYVPEGFAHGFLTLSDDALVLYQISVAHQPDAGRGVRWDDPVFGIEWPAAPTVISDRDATYPSIDVR